MHRRGPYYVAAFKRRLGHLQGQDLMGFASEDAAFRRGKALMDRVDGLVFFKIKRGEDGDIWSRVETLATVGDVPPEADGAA